MLQIITGKFFTTDDLYVTRQRGVLYTNYRYRMREAIVTSVGTLAPVSTRGDIASFVYEVDERLEAVRPNGQREFLMAVGLDCFIDDYADVMSFALNITCTPDLDLARRLTQAGQPSLGVPKLPSEYIRRMFDREIAWSDSDATQLQRFINDLVGLNRKDYKSAMRAIRRYVHGVHRVADDLDLAYSLLVASIESLAQDFDEFVPTWADYAQDKRQDFDKALSGASTEIIEGVRRTILQHEHLALGRRYREFVLNHLQSSFFREEAQHEPNPARRCDLPGALEGAYKSRSSYVHSLHELPRILTALPSHSDVVVIDNKPVLSLHGLARIARHVIHYVVAHAPKVEHENFDYRTDLPNMVQVPLADTYWASRQEGYSQATAKHYLSSFFRQLTGVWCGEIGVGLTDMRSIIVKIEGLVPGLAKPDQRLPLLTLYILFQQNISLEQRQPGWQKFAEKYAEDFDNPSIESLLLHMLTGQTPCWTLEQCDSLYAGYFKQRYGKNGLVCGAIFEAGLALFLAELHRQGGEEANARSLVQQAVENLPKHQQLLRFEGAMESPLQCVSWQDILLPPEPVTPDSKKDALLPEDKVAELIPAEALSHMAPDDAVND